MISYNKPPLSLIEQIYHLQECGIQIEDQDFATKVLKFVSLKRLKGYIYPPLKSKYFKDIWSLYQFDSEIRRFCLGLIELVEVGIRTVISNQMSLEYGIHWFERADLFSADEKHQGILKVIEKAQSKAKKDTNHHVGRFYVKYNEASFPPSWTVFEALTLGTVSTIYRSMKPQIQKKISREFGLNYDIFKSWLICIAALRNICAHHERLWNRVFTFKPIIQNEQKGYIPTNERFFAQFMVLSNLIKIIDPHVNSIQSLKNLMAKHHESYLKFMGFPASWTNMS